MVHVTNAQNVLVEKNLIDLEDPHVIQYRQCNEIHCFANQTSDGKPVLGYNNLAQPLRDDDELRTRIEDALLLAL
jgi:hypothetical protein